MPSIKDFDFNLTAGTTDEATRQSSGERPRDAPFRLAALGNFSGRAPDQANASSHELARRRFVRLDQDNFDALMAKMNVGLSLQLSGAQGEPPLKLSFAALDDFHPDRIFERVELFAKLKDTRKDLQHPQKFASAAAEVRSWLGTDAQTVPPSPQSALEDSATEVFAGGNLLDQMLAATETRSTTEDMRQSGHPTELSAFLSRIMEPHLTPKLDADHEALIDAVDAATGQLMRAILHHPEFQALEAAWCSLYFLVSRLELDTELQLHILDVSRKELAADLLNSDDFRTSGIYQLLVEQTVGTPGGTPWAIIIGDYAFGPSGDDLSLLERLGSIARRAGASFIAGADVRLLGCASLTDAPDLKDWQPLDDSRGGELWKALRRLPEAAYLGLALPRFILRLPYGAETDEAELFSFEEMPSGSKHQDYLWGNAAFACAYLLGTSFSRENWALRPNAALEIEGLPLHVYREDGETRTKPCAEITVSERLAEAITDRGLMPLLSFRDQDKVRLARFQSLADPPTRLAGPWE